MLSFIGIIAIVLVVIMFLIKVKSASNKRPQERTSFEQLLCSIFVLGKKNVDEASRTVRTASVMREEGLQKLREARRQLEESFRTNLSNLKLAIQKLKDSLPGIKDQPGKYEGKARLYKKESLEAEAQGKSEISAKKKDMAKKMLSKKKKAFDRIVRTEKLIEKLETDLEMAKINYDEKKTDIDEIEAELQSMIEIPESVLNNNLNVIRGIQTELNDRIREDRVRSEVDQELSDSGLESASSSEFDDEFDKL